MGGIALKLWSCIFFALAAVLTHLMCIVVTFNYVTQYYAGLYEGASAPAGIAFLLVIPFALVIAACVAVALILRRRSRKQ